MVSTKRRKKEHLISKLQEKSFERILHTNENECINEWLVLLNCSFDSGVSGSQLVAALKSEELWKLVDRIEMYDGQKSYSYMKAKSIPDAVHLFSYLNHYYIPLLQKELYLGFAIEIPFESFHSRPLILPDEIQKKIPGAFLFLDFFDESEKTLQHLFDLTNGSPWEILNKRSVQHYGYRFGYSKNEVGFDPLSHQLPQWCQALLKNAQELLLASNPDYFKPLFDSKGDSYFNQLTIYKYLPGQGIAPHVDSTTSFDSLILIISLISSLVMEFALLDQSSKIEIVIPARSLLVLSGDCRYKYTHSIRDRKIDVVEGLVIERHERISLTFRRLNPTI